MARVNGFQILFACGSFLQQGDKALPVAGTGNEIHPQLPHILGMGLGVAAAHRHHRRRVLLLHPVDRLPGLLVADRSNGAGVHNIGIRLIGKVHHLMAFCPEGLLHSLRFILIHLAAKGINGDFHSLVSVPFLAARQPRACFVIFSPRSPT